LVVVVVVVVVVCRGKKQKASTLQARLEKIWH
jgi:hypothetical protein